jgi:phosphoglycerate dehydrogenase-like enzyme
MNTKDKVAVCSRSFSKNKELRAALLSKYANVTFNDSGLQLEGDQLVQFLDGHDLAITALEKINDSILSKLPALRAIGKYGVGLDMIDFESMRKYGKRLGWTGGVNRRSVSELALAFAIVMLRHVVTSNREVVSGTWRQHVGRQLSDSTIGIIGCGNVGKDLVQLLKPFGCKLLVHDIVFYDEFYKVHNIEAVGLDKLLTEADVVTLHTPLDHTSKNILSKSHIQLMKSNAVLINTSRGGLVDEVALKVALMSGQLGAAAFDVFAQEPPVDMELLNLPNFLSTPHIGGSSAEAILAMGLSAIKGLEINEIP